LRPAIDSPVEESAARAQAHDLFDLVRRRHVREHPGSPLELEDAPVTTQAFGDVDAQVQVKADLDVLPAIDLTHCHSR
jgi:hypothetical protein